jgi:isocitrate dehydrogenase (NAD+)
MGRDHEGNGETLMVHTVTLFEGDGIGPEIARVARRVLDATGVPLRWDVMAAGGEVLPVESLESVLRNGVALKAPMAVEKLSGLFPFTRNGVTNHYPSLNNAIRREAGTFVAVRPVRSYAGLANCRSGVDVVVMRELTEDVYIGWEHRIGDDAAQAIKLVTRKASERLAHFAFQYARAHRRRKVTFVHKANALGATDGLFLRVAREVAAQYPDIASDDVMVDAAAFYLVRSPERFDVIATLNQYGDILSDLCAGLVGSLGLAPGGNFGDAAAIFEAAHGSAPDIAGRGIANPLALVLSGAMLLDHLGESAAATRVLGAVEDLVAEGRTLTPDLGGQASTDQVADDLVERLSHST